MSMHEIIFILTHSPMYFSRPVSFCVWTGICCISLTDLCCWLDWLSSVTWDDLQCLLVSWATSAVKATKPVSINLNNLSITGPGPDRMASGSSSLKRPSDYCGITTAITSILHIVHRCICKLRLPRKQKLFINNIKKCCRLLRNWGKVEKCCLTSPHLKIVFGN